MVELGFIETAHSGRGSSKDVQLSPSKSSHTLQFGHIVGFLSTEDCKTSILGGGDEVKDEDDKIERTRSFLFILIQEERYLFQ